MSSGKGSTYTSDVAEVIPFDNTTNGFVADDVQAAIEEAATTGAPPPIEALTEFESFTSAAQQNTTSNGWVTKSGYPYTTSSKTAGRFVINFTIQASNTDKEKDIGTRFQYRLDSGDPWITVVDIRDGVSTDGAFQLRTGFIEITLPVDGDFQVRWQFGQTDSGGTGRVREANITIGKASS